jgi:hypothetical protein
MKISIAKLNEAKQLRDAALILLDRNGLDTILADRGTRYRTRQIEILRQTDSRRSESTDMIGTNRCRRSSET